MNRLTPVFGLGILFAIVGLFPIRAHWQESTTTVAIETPKSWKWVPAETDFFWGFHHLEQQIERLQQSELAKRIGETAFWNKSYELFLKEWKDRKSDLAIWKARLDNPAAREIRAFLYDVASEDLFLYADKNLSKTIEQWNSITPAVEKLFSNELKTGDKADIVANWVDELLPKVQIPTLMVAGLIKDNNRALDRIDELEGAIRFGIGFIPDIAPLFRNLRRIEDDRGNRLEWYISGEMFPWEQIPETDILDRETIQDLRAGSKSKSITFSVGTLENYFCIVISGDREWAKNFGGDTHLSNHPEISSLLTEFASGNSPRTSTPIATSTYHSSDALIASIQKLSLDGFFRKIARAVLLPLIDQQPPESDTAVWLTSVLDDATWVDDRIGKHVVRYQGASKLSWMTDINSESVQIDRTPMQLMSSDHPLQGLRYTGRSPLLLLNMRLASRPEYFSTAREIVRRAKSSLDELVLVRDSQIDLDPIRNIHEQVREAWPLITSITEEWQQKILPNLTGEHLVVVQSGGLASDRWLRNFGLSESPLPLPEIALASGITNPDDFSSGTISIVDTLETLLSKYGISPPRTSGVSQIDGWNLATLPQPWSDAQVGKLEGIMASSERWHWLGYSTKQWQSFAKIANAPNPDTPAAIPFDEIQGPLASAALVHFGEIFQLANPWFNFLLDQAQTDSDGNLRIPPTSTGRRLAISPGEVKEFLTCLCKLGRLASFSKALPQGATLSRSRYE